MVTTPDTLAELIAKWRKFNRTDPAYGFCADELEAALDALVERWELMAEAFSNPLYTVTKPMDAVKAVRQCAAELRGRGASDAER